MSGPPLLKFWQRRWLWSGGPARPSNGRRLRQRTRRPRCPPPKSWIGADSTISAHFQHGRIRGLMLRFANEVEDAGLEWPDTDTIGSEGWHYQLRATMAAAIETLLKAQAGKAVQS
jgi:hypothetical protein